MGRVAITCPECGQTFKIREFRSTAVCYECQENFEVSSSQYY